MARKSKDSVLEDLLELGTRLSWKVGLPLALLCYLGFHYLSTLPINNPSSLNKMGEFILRNGGIALASILQYCVPFALLVGTVVGVFQRKQRRELLETRSGIESIREMTWQNFERLVGEAFKRKGYSVEERGGASADGGIDLILRRNGKKILVQCKRWKNLSIGVSHIRELYGVMVAERANGCIFVSSGTYTADARDFAKGKPIRLIDGEELVGMIAEVQTSGYIKASDNMEMKEETACPICGSHMALRRARKGANAGNEFWGCSKFPGCRGIRNI
jgi:restriction system protein